MSGSLTAMHKLKPGTKNCSRICVILTPNPKNGFKHASLAALQNTVLKSQEPGMAPDVITRYKLHH